MKVEWYCQVMGSEVGPMTESQLIDMVRQQKITPEDLVKRNDSSWVAAFEVKGLFAAAAKPPKPDAPTESSQQTEEVPVAASQPAADDSPQPTAEPSSDDADPADWYCIASGEKQGPIDFSELKALMAAGQLRRTDRVWRSSSPKFCRASEVDGLGTE